MVMRPPFGKLFVVALLSCSPPPPAQDFSSGTLPVKVERACPQGWSPMGAVCDAVLPSGDCAAGTMPVIGSTSCTPVGNTQCAAGFVPEPSGWGCTEVMPATACTGATMELIGQPDCQPVGDCAAAFPPAGAAAVVGPGEAFTTLGAALAAVTDGGVIALQPGTYMESAFTVNRNVSVVGRCPAQVTLLSPDGNDAAFHVKSGMLSLSGLTLKGHFNGLIADTGSTLNVDHCVLDANSISGINLEGGALTLTDSVVRNGQRDGSSDWGVGLYAVMGSNATVLRSSFSKNSKAGVLAQDKTTVSLDSVVVRDTRTGPGGVNGDGVVGFDGPTVTMKGCAVVHNIEAGLSVEGETQTTSFIVDSSVIRDTVPRTTPVTDPGNPSHKQYYGNNIEAQGKVSVTLTSTSLLRSGGESMILATTPAVASITDSTLYSSLVGPQGDSMSGLVVQAGGNVTLLRTAISAMSGVGIQENGNRCQLSMTGSLVAGTQSLGNQDLGHGVEVSADAGAVIDGSAITGSVGVGLLVGTHSMVSLDSSVVGWAGQYPDGGEGRGAEIFGASLVVMSSSAFVANRQVGIVIGDQGTLTQITSSVVRDTACTIDGLEGRGINVQQSGTLVMNDSLLSNNRDVALMVAMTGSTGTVQSSVVTGTQFRLSDMGFGIAVASLDHGRVDLKQTQILQSAGTALTVGTGAATVDACTIAHNNVALQVGYGSTLQQVMSIPDMVGPLDVFVTDDTVFDANMTRLGEGTVPLPESM
jgi:hypothetical protein